MFCCFLLCAIAPRSQSSRLEIPAGTKDECAPCEDAFPLTSELFGYVLIVAFFCEFLARAKAQGGERFFRPMYNKLEICVLVAGTEL